MEKTQNGATTGSHQRYTVYRLVDPLTSQIRYVGQTRHPSERLLQHLSAPGSQAMIEWIQSLKSQGVKPCFEVIVEDLTETEALHKEKDMIEAYRLQGYPLLNVQCRTKIAPRERHSLYLDNAVVERTAQAYKDTAYDLYPAEITKSDFLEACLEYALGHLDQIKVSLTEHSEDK
jgi:hypothetical protein